MKIIRLFPRRTTATPNDALVRVDCPPGLFDEADEVHISVAFIWDLPVAERLENLWRHVAPVRIGGPATGERGGNFTPGMYLKPGYVITSRGCPNRCWFCSVPKREGALRELAITDGWNILDDNLLACPEEHIRAVFAMLHRQKRVGHRAEFTGGLEAAKLQPWHVEEIRKLAPESVFFAYDTPDDLEPLVDAGRLFQQAGYGRNNHHLRAYVLCGYAKDTFEAAEKRMRQVVDAGFWPMAMVWRNRHGNVSQEWARFQRLWARPAISANLAKGTNP